MEKSEAEGLKQDSRPQVTSCARPGFHVVNSQWSPCLLSSLFPVDFSKVAARSCLVLCSRHSERDFWGWMMAFRMPCDLRHYHIVVTVGCIVCVLRQMGTESKKGTPEPRWRLLFWINSSRFKPSGCGTGICGLCDYRWDSRLPRKTSVEPWECQVRSLVLRILLFPRNCCQSVNVRQSCPYLRGNSYGCGLPS